VGCRWCDCPTGYGPCTPVYNRFNKLSYLGFCLKLPDAGVATRSAAINSMYVTAFGGKVGLTFRYTAALAEARRPRSTPHSKVVSRLLALMLIPATPLT